MRGVRPRHGEVHHVPLLHRISRSSTLVAWVRRYLLVYHLELIRKIWLWKIARRVKTSSLVYCSGSGFLEIYPVCRLFFFSFLLRFQWCSVSKRLDDILVYGLAATFLVLYEDVQLLCSILLF